MEKSIRYTSLSTDNALSGRVHKIRRGLDIRLQGQAEKVFCRVSTPGEYSLYPSDFPTLVPRLLVREGDAVEAGSPIFCDKKREAVLFCSPVHGEVKSVLRGERRRIEKIVIECRDEQVKYVTHEVVDVTKLSREDIVNYMLRGGVFPFIRQRPFNVIADPNVTPRDIFISAFATGPLSPDYDFAIKSDAENFQLGIDILTRLTPGKVHLGVNAKYPPNPAFSNVKGVQFHRFSGKHPVGNVGVQIHHIAPVNKGEVVWTVNPLDVVIIGRLFGKGHYDARRNIALAGSCIQKPRYYTALPGVSMKVLLNNQLCDGLKSRIISGSVLTGTKCSDQDGLHFYDTQVSVIPEGDKYEFMGWAMPGFKKFSASRLFLSFLTPHRTYNLDTNMHGGERAFVLNGQYERVFPMRVYPVHLLKAILADDFEGMENLGIYEVSEEEFALCDFVCTSKIEAQSIVRRGLNRMIYEMN